MKNLITITITITIAIALCFITFKTNAQTFSVTPDVNGEFCPNVDYTFKVSGLPASPFQIRVESNLNAPILVSGNPQFPSTFLPFTFVARFRDVSDRQSFNIIYSNGSTQQPPYPIIVTRIKSLAQSPQGYCNQILPGVSNPTNPLFYERCKITTQNIAFDNMQYSTRFGFPDVCFGNISTYEYLIPNGWKLGNTVSDGTNWLPAGNNVNVTSDLETGGNIRIRPTNVSCGLGLEVNNAYTKIIPINRPALASPFINGPASFCNSEIYSIPLPASATITWAATGSFAISGSVNANPVTLVKTSIGVGTLNATINYVCGTTNAVPKTVNVGLLPIAPNFSESQVPVTLVGSILEPTVCIPWGTSKQIKIRLRNVRNLQVTPIYGISTLSSGSEYITYQFNYSLSVCVIIVDYDTDCGHIRNSIVVRNPCYNPTYTFAVSPNPANSTLKISQETNLAPAQSKAATPLAQEIAVSKASFEVKLFDDKGNVVLNDKSMTDSKDITLNTQNIPNGFYFLHITEGKETVVKQIIIQH
ncbi:MAG: T9SS C-terminal target domain-containing protein [Sphingobacteriales bacterium]|nr:MAG: T9SS C-terminal target domain-containing protein [Sphingobacteriales bacterium]